MTPGNLIVPIVDYAYWVSFIGWTFLNESSTSSVCLCTDASTTKLLSTWRTTAHQYPTLPIVNGYVLPVVMKSSFHVTGSAPMDVGHLPLLTWLSGTKWQSETKTYGERHLLVGGLIALQRLKLISLPNSSHLCHTHIIYNTLFCIGRICIKNRHPM